MPDPPQPQTTQGPVNTEDWGQAKDPGTFANQPGDATVTDTSGITVTDANADPQANTVTVPKGEDAEAADEFVQVSADDGAEGEPDVEPIEPARDPEAEAAAAEAEAEEFARFGTWLDRETSQNPELGALGDRGQAVYDLFLRWEKERSA